jgi:hypothetical protein
MGEGRDNRFSFRMADDERRVLVAQSLYSVATTCLCVATTSCRVQLNLAATTEAAGKSPRAGVNPTFAANERGKRFGFRFVLHRVPPHARPFGSRSPADLSTISGAENYCGDRFVVVGRRMFCRRKAFWAHDQVSFHSPNTAN